MDESIPLKWRLKQTYLDKNNPPCKFPVFLKPEWGQNSNGIKRADSKDDFLAFNHKKAKLLILFKRRQQKRKNMRFSIFVTLIMKRVVLH